MLSVLVGVCQSNICHFKAMTLSLLHLVVKMGKMETYCSCPHFTF